MLDSDDEKHMAVKAFDGEGLFIPTTVMCEVDYFLTKYFGEHIAKEFFERVSDNQELLVFDATDLVRVNEIRRFYNDLPLGFVDASLVALAERYGIRQILTLDRRHFRAVQPQGLGHFELLP